MLVTDQIHRIIRESALRLHQDVNPFDIPIGRAYESSELEEFKRDLLEAGNQMRILFLDYTLSKKDFLSLISTLDWPVLLFRKDRDRVLPTLLSRNKKAIHMQTFLPEHTTDQDLDMDVLEGSLTEEVSFYAVVAYEALVDSRAEAEPDDQPITPLRRLIKLLKGEKKDIFYILFYAIFVGIISLVIPLGIQTTVELVSGGVFFSSIYVLIGLIIVGVLLTGGIQIFQISLVEYLQRRIFTKAAYEFAYRLPRVRNDAMEGHYAPELVNRFFDVIIIQKGLPKLLIDLSSAVLQIFFGLVLISLYHPFFVFFGITLLGTLVLIFLYSGPGALRSSILESKYKYRVVYWLQELGRAMNSFKVTGNTMLPLRKTDYYVNNYLKYRKNHFQALLAQFSYIVIFKTLITAALLILGTVLVVNRQITLGQFVASEVIIILVLASVEKIITYMDVVYDMLTAVDKIGHVTDLPLERHGGLDFPKAVAHLPFSVQLKDVSFQYSPKARQSLRNVTLDIVAGECVCISGAGSSGKTSLSHLIAGLHVNFEGSVSINRYSIRDLDITNVRDRIAKNISAGDIFDGTFLENISVGKTSITQEDIHDALDKAGLLQWMNEQPEGLNTRLISGGKGFSTTVIQKLILARCLAKKPSLLVLNEFFSAFGRTEKLRLLEMLTSKHNGFTFVTVSNDPLVMAACDRVILMQEGTVKATGTFEELLAKNLITSNVD